MPEPIYKNVTSRFVEAPPEPPKEGSYLFYTFTQNNSGGSFRDSDDYGECCIVAARSAEEANERAEQLGIYFNGCDIGYDCSCCGDRWYRVNDHDGHETPEVYGQSPEAILAEGGFRSKIVVHYPDGSKRILKRSDPKKKK